VLDVFAGVSSVALRYKAVHGLNGCKVFFDGQGKIVKAAAHYDRGWGPRTGAVVVGWPE
jgi:hypothetical protein